MKIPENQQLQDLANYWGINTLGKFKKAMCYINDNAKIMYYNTEGKQFVRAREIKNQLFINN